MKRKNIAIRLTIVIVFTASCLSLLFFTTGKEKQTGSVVGEYGRLRVGNGHIVDQTGEPVALKGMSLFWSQWQSEFYNYDCIKWLRDDWNCQVIRAALSTGSNGYAKHPEKEMDKIRKVIDACIDLDLYVIVDWHSHHAEKETDLAREFFREISRLYGNYPNVIYEIYNEPVRSSWEKDVKPYCSLVTETIRKYDPDNVIVVGTPHWSQDVDIVAGNPISGKNIAYSLHFYAATHKEWLREKAQVAIDSGLALWVTEFGTCESDGNGPIDYVEMEKWFDFMEKNKIGWCNWSIGVKEETSSALKPGAKNTGKWPESMLSESGAYIRNKLTENTGSPE
ncbi:MAG: glycoside hydrolase family 5 protein [Bacteroidales bacterium]|jgi:endoglucanase